MITKVAGKKEGAGLEFLSTTWEKGNAVGLVH
jgi:hypothetical protein